MVGAEGCSSFGGSSSLSFYLQPTSLRLFTSQVHLDSGLSLESPGSVPRTYNSVTDTCLCECVRGPHAHPLAQEFTRRIPRTWQVYSRTQGCEFYSEGYRTKLAKGRGSWGEVPATRVPSGGSHTGHASFLQELDKVCAGETPQGLSAPGFHWSCSHRQRLPSMYRNFRFLERTQVLSINPIVCINTVDLGRPSYHLGKVLYREWFTFLVPRLQPRPPLQAGLSEDPVSWAGRGMVFLTEFSSRSRAHCWWSEAHGVFRHVTHSQAEKVCPGPHPGSGCWLRCAPRPAGLLPREQSHHQSHWQLERVFPEGEE